ncbi:hypothetical protein CEXT_142681 [Caerostris extrusa]|uniref:Uncharacterized protein n=1 Tax=Caerostris extrusa TaxID=172846 RepID=A0AAV4ULS6_CAEEX|nr:hypothetical protein CEXT_142681 [Caerostris extrusa]
MPLPFEHNKTLLSDSHPRRWREEMRRFGILLKRFPFNPCHSLKDSRGDKLQTRINILRPPSSSQWKVEIRLLSCDDNLSPSHTSLN